MTNTELFFKREFKSLNNEQKQVVRELDKNILLLASAGTGKTNSLALRISNIINNDIAKPEEILCLTFTNGACKEMKDRLTAVVGERELKILIKTFHGFCFDIIKSEAKRSTDISFDFTIFDEEDCKEIIKEFNPQKYSVTCLQKFINYMKEQSMEKEGSDYKGILLNLIKLHKDKFIDICKDEHYKFNHNIYEFLGKYGHRLVEAYNKSLYEKHGLDFNDLLIKVNELFKNDEIVNTWSSKFKYIHVDEVQDTSKIEYNIVSKLFKENNVMMCGDYFQTIYEWRGSKPKNILELFEKDFSPEKIVFNKNYRATETLLNASYSYLKNAFPKEVDSIYNFEIEANSDSIGKNIQLRTADDIYDEGRWIFNKIKQLNLKDLSKAAVLTRNNRINVQLSSVFKEENLKLSKADQIQFLLVDEFKFFRRQEIKDLTAYLNLIINKFDSGSLKRILRRFCRGVGDKTIELLTNKEMRNAGVRLTDFIDKNTQKYGELYQLLLNELEKANVVVFDVESTGVNVTEDEIIQIAAVRINIKGDVIEEFERILRPDKSVGTSEFVHHFSDEYLRDNGEEREVVLKDFLEFIKGSLIVGHNVSYDISILTSELMRLGIELPDFIDFYDTLDIARRFYPRLPNHKLETLSKFFNTNVKSSHDAMYDVKATGEVLIKMLNDNIKPTIINRINIYNKYLKKFYNISLDIERLRQKSFELRPSELVKEIIKASNIADIYSSDENRINNIKEFCDILTEMDDVKLNCKDSLIEILKTVSLSNSELDRKLKKHPKVPIITVHQAKGAEFDYVFLAGLCDYVFPSYQSIKKNNLDEEKRVFYVAITRAKKQLFMSWSNKDSGNSKTMSRFIDYIPEKYIDKN